MFFKRTTPLFDTQLESLAQKVVAAAETVVELLEHPEGAEAHSRTVSELEHAADRIVRDTIALQSASLGAIERADLLRLLERVDDIVDVADAVAERLWLHQVGDPTQEARALAGIFLQSARGVQLLVLALRRMKAPHEVLDQCVEIARLEAEGDALYRKAMLALFSGRHDALYIARWKPVYERLERGVNRCEDVARLVEGFIQAIA